MDVIRPGSFVAVLIRCNRFQVSLQHSYRLRGRRWCKLHLVPGESFGRRAAGDVAVLVIARAMTGAGETGIRHTHDAAGAYTWWRSRRSRFPRAPRRSAAAQPQCGSLRNWSGRPNRVSAGCAIRGARFQENEIGQCTHNSRTEQRNAAQPGEDATAWKFALGFCSLAHLLFAPPMYPRALQGRTKIRGIWLLRGCGSNPSSLRKPTSKPHPAPSAD